MENTEEKVEIDFIISDDCENERFNAMTKTGELIGEIMYQNRGAYLDIYHTGVEPEFEGKGLASKIATKTLELIRSKGQQIYPRCPYLKSFIDRHAEFSDLIYS